MEKTKPMLIWAVWHKLFEIKRLREKWRILGKLSAKKQSQFKAYRSIKAATRTWLSRRVVTY